MQKDLRLVLQKTQAAVLKFGVLPHFWLYHAQVLPHITAVLPQQEIVAKRDKKRDS
jgi:hypothetical protein